MYQLRSHIVLKLVIAFLLQAGTVSGAEIDSVTAGMIAKNFYSSRSSLSHQLKSNHSGDDVEVVLRHVEYMASSRKAVGNYAGLPRPLYYIFEADNQQGFIIVSGTDLVIPVLGYSFTGGFSEHNQPPAFRNWMEHWQEQISYMIENIDEPDPEIQRAWNDLLAVPATKGASQLDEVTPLLATAWSQECYYNAYCPADIYGPCGNALVGCVAVAMSQIMKYWDHPVSGNQIPGYYAGDDYGCLPDIESSAYDWSNMPSTLTSFNSGNEVDAVAELLYHAGVAVNMNYGSDGSGAYSIDAKNALYSYFNYSSSMQQVSRLYIDEESWVQLIMNELDNQRPVYYGGSGTIGHAFVCDGYQDTSYFHFNWGWGGNSDGYFYLNDLTPGGEDFNSSQTAIIGISPDVESQPDPLDHIIDIDDTGAGYTQTFSSDGAGAWDQYMCYNSTPGLEQLYRFTPQTTGYYSIEVVSASGQMAYGIRQAECGEPEWECVGEIGSTGSYGNFAWTAGTPYYILLDDPNLTGNSHQFYVNDPLPATPVVEYHSYEIDDDAHDASSGDGDGLVEGGEIIELSISLENTGDFNVHNISGILSATDPDIIISLNTSDFGDISSGGRAQSLTDYIIQIAEDCPEKDVSFDLEISSDEATWTERFTIRVLVDIPPAPVLTFDSHQIDDNTASGDGDGLVEQGEMVNLQLTLRNTGDLIAANVSAVVSISDPDIDISVDSCTFGSIGISSSAASADNFVFSVSPDCPEKDVTFSLDIYADEGIWTDEIVVHVYPYDPPAPELEYSSHQIDDNTSSGDGDGQVDAGETIHLPITIRNNGDAGAHSVSAILSAVDSDIQVVGESNNFQDLGPGASTQSSGNYVFKVSPDCGEKDVAFTLVISSDEGSWTDQFLLHVYPGITSISDEVYTSALEVYPNPAKEALWLKSGNGINSPFEIWIMDSQGRISYQQNHGPLPKGDVIQLDLSKFKPGMYFLKVLHSDQSEITMFIVE